MDEPLHYLTVVELSRAIASRALSPVEVTRWMLERIEALDGRIKAYATVTAEPALDAARAAEAEISAGRYRGPLHGVPVAVKDLCFTRGVRTMGGCAVLAEHVPDHDATVVARLASAGAILLGKLNLTEGAMGGYNPRFAVPENPWRAGHWSGASSSGSGAATAAGLAYATLGSDTGGSIRHPAAVCGTVGLKPTWGRVSRRGVIPLAPSLDHVGPLTRSSADAGIVLGAIAGRDAGDPTSLVDPVPDMLGGIDAGVDGLTVGWDEVYSSRDLAPDHAASLQAAVGVLEALGARIVAVRMPERLREYLDGWQVLCASEAAAAHAETFPARAEEYGPWFRGWLERGAAYRAVDYARANGLRSACAGELEAALAAVDLLACPATAREAYPVSPAEAYGPIPPERDPWQSRFTVPTDYAGLPTIALPCGLSANRLPLSLQLVGHRLAEPLLVRAGAAFEAATDWHRLHPPVDE